MSYRDWWWWWGVDGVVVLTNWASLDKQLPEEGLADFVIQTADINCGICGGGKLYWRSESSGSRYLP